MKDRLQKRTIEDFSRQWMNYQDNTGYYGSVGFFEDIFFPLIAPSELKGCRVAEIGSGTGRIANMLLQCGVSYIIAVEPSDAFDILKKNTYDHKDRMTYLKLTGDKLPPSHDLDFIFSVGVLHHIPDPSPVVDAAFAALRPGGKFAVWVYGKEGNGLYLVFLKLLRMVSTRLSHRLLAGLSWLLYLYLVLYLTACKVFPLPLHRYMSRVIEPMSPEQRRLIIYDQLNPAYAKYYTYHEIYDLLKKAGFGHVRIHHRHGYSWTAIGTKPRLL